MRRFSLRELASATPAGLTAELRSRLAAQSATLEAVHVPAALAPACAKLRKAWAAAAASDADDGAAALALAEDGAAAAASEIQKLPAPERSAAAPQRLLRATFTAIVGHRALVQASAVLRADEALLLPSGALDAVLSGVVEDSQAFCREKNGDYPEARVTRISASGSSGGSDGAPDVALFAPFVAFSLHELLKNAMGAHVRRVGADKLDQLPPLEVRHGLRNGVAFVGVTDFGGGWAEAPETAVEFLRTTNPEREPTYTYSRNFGSTFEGLGMGLPLAALHAEYLGGRLHLQAVQQASPQRPAGVHASFTFDATAASPEPDVVAWGV